MSSHAGKAMLALAAAWTVGCEKPAVVTPPPPRCTWRPSSSGTCRSTSIWSGRRGIPGRRDPRARRRLPRDRELPGGVVRHARATSSTRSIRKPLEARSPQAKADQATAQARLEKANNDVARYTPLVAKQAVSQQELDNARAAQDAARSQVEAAKAAVEKATLDLGYTRITSPIGGLVGTTKVKPGNLVGRGESTLLTTISQIDPIRSASGSPRPTTCASSSAIRRGRGKAPRGRRASS